MVQLIQHGCAICYEENRGLYDHSVLKCYFFTNSKIVNVLEYFFTAVGKSQFHKFSQLFLKYRMSTKHHHRCRCRRRIHLPGISIKYLRMAIKQLGQPSLSTYQSQKAWEFSSIWCIYGVHMAKDAKLTIYTTSPTASSFFKLT